MEKISTEMPRAERRTWTFAQAVLDEASLELRVAGRLISLERKPLDVLVHLLHHAGEVVTKDELIDAAWGGRIVSESVLAKAVGKLREALSDEAQQVIKTVHGYGYRLAAPVEVRHEHSAAESQFAFQPGSRIPGRPLWSLTQRLGAGGQGEAWLATHDKTRERRVFKFALDSAALSALKREITLFRFLNDSLGDQVRIVPLRDWNLERAPCFLEADYVVGGSLVEWAERGGGVANMPLRLRLDIAAQVAEALATVHSVGVLHKDLKPSNVLIQSQPGGDPRVLLADFGSGGVLDLKRLEALGITRLGFTRTVSALKGQSGGTPLYLAPELLAGQPPTVKGDIYALGVMLYQLVVGEFRKAMSAGWEREVHDELLCEYIAEAAEGDPAHRLGDAALFAQRLRGLDEERRKRRADAETQRKARELEHALAVARSSHAVADFLSKDLFAVVGSRPLRDLTVRELLIAASEKLATRFHDMPLAAAQIHAALGNAFWTMESMDEAREHLHKALTHFEQLGMTGAEPALPVAAQLMTVDFTLGQGLSNLARYQRVLDDGRATLGFSHPAVLSLSQQIAWMRFGAGEWRQAAAELQRVMQDAQASPGTGADAVLDSASLQLGRALTSLGEFAAAEEVLRAALSRLGDKYGTTHISVAQARVLLGATLVRQGRHDEAEGEISVAEKLLQEWAAPDSTAQLMSARYLRAQLLLDKGRTDEAIGFLEEVLQALEPLGWMQKSGFVGDARAWLAFAYLAAGRLNEAAAMMQSAVELSEKACGPAHPQSLMARIGLADIEQRRANAAGARELLARLDRPALDRLGAPHPLVADFLRVDGLVHAAEGNLDEARMALTAAVQIREDRLGTSHASSAKLRAELAQLGGEVLLGREG